MTLDEALLELIERQDWEAKQRMGELMEGIKAHYTELERKLEVARDALWEITVSHNYSPIELNQEAGGGFVRPASRNVPEQEWMRLKAKQALTATETASAPETTEGDEIKKLKQELLNAKLEIAQLKITIEAGLPKGFVFKTYTTEGNGDA